jgi:hypothetical protein
VTLGSAGCPGERKIEMGYKLEDFPPPPKKDSFRYIDRSKVKVTWDDCSAGFYCECGEGEFIVNFEGEEVICRKCGRIYRSYSRIEVDESRMDAVLKVFSRKD